MDANNMTQPVFDFADKKAYKQVIILMLGMILFFGTICYSFWIQHLKDVAEDKQTKNEIINNLRIRVDKLETDNDALRKDYRDAVTPANKILDSLKSNVKKLITE